MANSRDELLYRVAKRHYIDGMTMEMIAQELGVSRPTVSRLVAKARETGMVRITLAEPPGSDSPTARALSKAFDAKVHIVNVAENTSPTVRLRSVAMVAAQVLNTLVRDETSLGVAWGVTAAQVARQLRPIRLRGVKVVQMNGSAHATDTGLPYVGALLQMYANAYGDAQVIPFPVPTFFDHASTKKAMWRERSVQNVLREMLNLDVALFGVGYPSARVPSHVYSSGYIDPDDLSAALRMGAVGDVCTVMLRADGSYKGIPLNDRASGLTPDDMKQIERRICVVGDPSRAGVLLAALRSGAVTDLVCDNLTARIAHRNLMHPGAS